MRRFALDEAALIIAAHIDPALDVDAELARLDEVAAQAEAPTLEGLVDLLFVRMRLRGDTWSYDDPLNSSLPHVLDRRSGVPISLSVLVMEIGRRLGLVFQGVGMPGHFLVRHISGNVTPAVLLDPYGGGRQLDPGACRRLYTSITGSSQGWSPNLLAATPPIAIASRILANLTSSYTTREDLAGRRWVAELRSALPERSPEERLTVASELAQTGAFVAAAEMIESTAARIDGLDGMDGTGSDHPDAARLRAQARSVRARLN